MTFSKEEREALQKYINTCLNNNFGKKDSIDAEIMFGKKNANIGKSIMDVRKKLDNSSNKRIASIYEELLTLIVFAQGIAQRLKDAIDVIDTVDDLNETLEEMKRISEDTKEE